MLMRKAPVLMRKVPMKVPMSPPPAPLIDLAEIAAAAGGPTPRDAVPVCLVAVACADAARVYVSEPTTGRLTLLASAEAPEGGAATELRFAPDGRTLALAAEGGGFAVFAVPAPIPEAYYPEPEPEPERGAAG